MATGCVKHGFIRACDTRQSVRAFSRWLPCQLCHTQGRFGSLVVVIASAYAGCLSDHAFSGLPADFIRPSRVKALPAWAPLTWPAFLVPKAREGRVTERR